MFDKNKLHLHKNFCSFHCISNVETYFETKSGLIILKIGDSLIKRNGISLNGVRNGSKPFNVATLRAWAGYKSCSSRIQKSFPSEKIKN